MLKNYLKTAWRSLTTSTAHSLVNIIGLALGLSACMLIMLYAGHEWSYDRFHENANRIYCVQAKLKLGSDSVYMPYLNYSTGPVVKTNAPSVADFLRIKQPDREAVIQNVKSPSLKFTENKFLFADSNFFDFFSFRLLAGNKAQVLQNPFSVVLSQTAAIKYFGKENPIGKRIRYNNAYDFVVTGVAGETPSNSSIAYDFVAPVSSLYSMVGQRDLLQNDENIFSTYFLLKPLAEASQLEAGLEQLNKTRNASRNDLRYIAIPLKNLHTYVGTDKSNRKYLELFPAVAGIILLLAIFNYISLTTARSSVRAKEIGIRKVLGASRGNLALQFFLESTLYTTIAFALGYAMFLFFQPFFFRFLQLPVDSSFLYNPAVLYSFAIMYVGTVLFSAIYPSVLLSAYKPASVLYGKFSAQSGGLSVRKFATVFQFAISVILITSGIIIQRQVSFIRHADTGIQRDHVVMIPFGQNVGKNHTAFKNDLLSLSAVQEVSVALHPLFSRYDMMGVTPRNATEMMFLPTLMVDQHFISLLKLQWSVPPVDSVAVLEKKNIAVLNETAVDRLNLGPQPVNQEVDNQFEVVGVLKNFNYTSLQNKIEPLCLLIVPDSDTSASWSHQGGCFFTRLVPGANVSSSIDQLKRIYEKYEREKPFELHFLDEAFDAQYTAEMRLSDILNTFTAFAILIASLGLFGLVTFMTGQRTKEIGVRKVLGASVPNIVLLISQDFIKLVLLAIVIASPIAWWAVAGWLQNFAYRINIEWWMFAAAGTSAIVIALLTVSYHAVKAARANPVRSLRTG